MKKPGHRPGFSLFLCSCLFSLEILQQDDTADEDETNEVGDRAGNHQRQSAREEQDALKPVGLPQDVAVQRSGDTENAEQCGKDNLDDL